MKKILLVLLATAMLTSCSVTINSDVKTSVSTTTPTEEVTQKPKETESAKATYTKLENYPKSACTSLTDIKSFSFNFLTDDDDIYICTSAKKEDGSFEWDDAARFVVEIKSDEKYYDLYDSTISNGCVYFDVLTVGNKPYVFVKELSSASDYIKVYCVKDGSICQTNELDLNKLGEMDINLLYTSHPTYR